MSLTQTPPMSKSSTLGRDGGAIMPSIASRTYSTGCYSKTMLAHEERYEAYMPHTAAFPMFWTLPELASGAGIHGS